MYTISHIVKCCIQKQTKDNNNQKMNKITYELYLYLHIITSFFDFNIHKKNIESKIKYDESIHLYLSSMYVFLLGKYKFILKSKYTHR